MTEHTTSDIQIFITGGTICKDYHLSGDLYFPDTTFTELIQHSRLTNNIKVDVLMQKDSLDIVDHDRNIILNSCRQTDIQQIIIFHGTDTMIETALFIQQNIESLNNKIIILTGAMRPYALGKSDAMFNFGTAIAFVKNLNGITKQSAVFIAMNGQLFKPNEVRKNKTLFIFEESLKTP